MSDEIRECKSPLYKTNLNYPICNLGGKDGLPLIELHFLHYKSFEEAHQKWEERKKRINFNRLFAVFAFHDDTDEEWLKRFDAIDIDNKIAFVNRPFPQYKSAIYVPGYESNGIGVLGGYVGISGHRKYDIFDFANWFNQGCLTK